MTNERPSTGLLIIGHGTRDQQGCDEFLRTAQQVEARLPSVPVAAGFLELAEPTIDQAIESLVRREARRIVVCPLLLLAAGHARQDIPEAIQRASRRWPQLSIQLADHLGCDSRMLRLSALRFQQAAAQLPAGARLGCLMVGRGSGDPQAVEEMLSFSTLRMARTPVERFWTAFVAVARPSLSDIQKQIATDLRPWKLDAVVVQPHLLFVGRVLQTIQNWTHAVAPRLESCQWICSPHLGVHELLVDAILDRLKTCQDRVLGGNSMVVDP